jgi:hypothetical protein
LCFVFFVFFFFLCVYSHPHTHTHTLAASSAPSLVSEISEDMHIYVLTCVSVNAYMHTAMYVCERAPVRTCVFMYLCTYARMYVRMYVYVCMYVCIYVCMYTYVHTSFVLIKSATCKHMGNLHKIFYIAREAHCNGILQNFFLFSHHLFYFPITFYLFFVKYLFIYSHAITIHTYVCVCMYAYVRMYFLCIYLCMHVCMYACV